MLQGPKRLRECRLGGMFHHRGRARREFPLAPWTSVSALGFLFGEFLRLCEWGALCYYIRSIEFARYQVLGCHFNEMLEAVFLRPRKAPCRSGGCTDHASKRFKCIDMAQQAGGTGRNNRFKRRSGGVLCSDVFGGSHISQDIKSTSVAECEIKMPHLSDV